MSLTRTPGVPQAVDRVGNQTAGPVPACPRGVVLEQRAPSRCSRTPGSREAGVCSHVCCVSAQVFPGLILSDIKPAKRLRFRTVCYLLVQLMHCRKMFKAEIPFSNVMTCEDDDKVGCRPGGCRAGLPSLPRRHLRLILYVLQRGAPRFCGFMLRSRSSTPAWQPRGPRVTSPPLPLWEMSLAVPSRGLLSGVPRPGLG